MQLKTFLVEHFTWDRELDKYIWRYINTNRLYA